MSLYKREPLSKYIKMVDASQLSGNFTSVDGVYMDPLTRKTGFYKMNACFWGEPDLRELLASIILKKIGIPCADIQLIYDDVKEHANGCLSMNILKPGEKFVETPNNLDFVKNPVNFGSGIEHYLNADTYLNKLALPNLPEDFWNFRKDFLINYVFVSALLGNDDIKSDNCQIIYNPTNYTYRNPEYYDMGMAFSGLSRGRAFYEDKGDKDVLLEIYQKYPEKVKNLSRRIGATLTQKYVKKLLKDEAFSALSEEERKRIWTELGDKISLINKANEYYYGDNIKSNGFNVGHESLMSVSRKTPLNLKEKASRFFSTMRGKNSERGK